MAERMRRIFASSSTTKIFLSSGFMRSSHRHGDRSRLGIELDGELDLEGSTQAELALNSDRAFMGLDDPISDGQAEPRSAAFGRVEGIEDLVNLGLGDAAAAVLDAHEHGAEVRR